MDAVTVRGWSKRFGELANRVGPCFARHDLRSQATGYLRGLLGSVERKNSWQLSEHLGREKPSGIQRLLGRASWDAGEVRDALLRYASEHLLGPGDPGVLIVDETGFLKKGDKSAGVRWWIARCTCPHRGAPTNHGARKRACRKTRHLRRSRNWR